VIRVCAQGKCEKTSVKKFKDSLREMVSQQRLFRIATPEYVTYLWSKGYAWKPITEVSETAFSALTDRAQVVGHTFGGTAEFTHY